MHLLAAQPGGFVDDEGIVDLDQSPANMVILSAADSSLASLATACESLPLSLPSVRLANWMQLVKPAAFDLYQHKVLDKAQVVVVSLLGGESYWRYGFERLCEWVKAEASRTLILVPGDDAEDPQLLSASNVGADAARRVWRYLREGGHLNSQQLLLFLASEYLACTYRWQEPRPLPRCMIYLPEALRTKVVGSVHASSGGQASMAEWQKRWQSRLQAVGQNFDQNFDQSVAKSRAYNAEQISTSNRVCALLFYRSHLQGANSGMFDALIEVLEAQGLQPLPIAVASLKDPESIALVNALIEQSQARLIINTTSFASNTVGCPGDKEHATGGDAAGPSDFQSPFKRQIPVLQLILSSSTEQDWREHKQGLRSRDIAMQVVLPEMDGRIITRPISFKSESYFSQRCEISVVRYQLFSERAVFVAKLAERYCRLANTANGDKRIALILANYPTKDGRIGNGVGLDTPASTINVLQALKAAGYSLGDELPHTGTELIQQLLGSVTNNPDTLMLLPCWQSMSVEAYMAVFDTLPEVCREAVWQRWGPPEQDPKYRDGRLMIAGMRLGETFIGIQPARGFNIDASANYHDPDLVPPHAYLAFYFWLRESYKVEAVVHIGKHGNLEWLPGKGAGLSNSCWPDIALGPMPHFYPFIVNDPGEGAQAKRRTQAVIIDHLMPPLTRAETYGELAELEGLVDEYYQALGMDVRREQWLREEILKLVRDTNVLQELGLASGSNDDDVLAELDTYLCDIKEAQIRHGLHILGQLPDEAKLGDTLVALLRLPRGDRAESQGILHNLALDLALTNGGDFDPLQVDAQPWLGLKPEILKQQSADIWRTSQDTRERLELLALTWVQHFVLAEGDASLLSKFPRTQKLLTFARQHLLQALEQSVDNEIGSLLKGLSGQFIPPGPSGAPSRGRLDTLPTGRNFFSLDNRSVPSKAAWAIGQASAQALIERHLQEHGEYPAQLGLSVWGTATMRTGGDDIAQAFALMGIKPIWAEGSQRVVDFEIIPGMLLQRPRVDVTLRVSGFFRDAFPNVMKLYDAAVQKLAALREPGGNLIRDNIEARKKELRGQGMSAEDAARQASYRVFGSKPGAYGAGLQGLIDERCWEQSSDLAEAYLNWGGYAYGVEAGDGVEARQAFQHRLSNLEVVVQNQDNREHDLLDSDDYYQFQGGMSNAVKIYGGEMPKIYHGDHSNPAAPKIRTLKEELNRVIRSRVLNPKWIGAMREHGYKGAFEMAASIDYLFAYDATTNLIDDYQYEKVADALVFDQDNRAFLEEHNPNALEEMAERLLEACQRKLWQQPGDYECQLQELLLNIDEQQEGT